MTWLIKNQFHWDNLMLALMGGAGSVIPILSMHLQGKGICLESSFPQNWKLLKMLFFPKLSLAWQPVDTQRSWAAAAFPGTYQTFSQLNIFGFVLVWVLCLCFVLFCFFPKRKLQNRNFLQNLHWFCHYFTRKSFSFHGSARETGRIQDLRVSQNGTLFVDV